MKAYISCQLSTQDTVKGTLCNKLRALGYEVSLYTKGTTYSDKDLRAADVIILVDQKTSFIHNLTTGCAKEVALAIALEKPVYIFRDDKKIWLLNQDQLSIDKRLILTDEDLDRCPQIINEYQIY